jgi:hypothetical protein
MAHEVRHVDEAAELLSVEMLQRRLRELAHRESTSNGSCWMVPEHSAVDVAWPLIASQIEGWRKTLHELHGLRAALTVLLDELQGAWWLKAAAAYNELRGVVPPERFATSLPSPQGE